MDLKLHVCATLKAFHVLVYRLVIGFSVNDALGINKQVLLTYLRTVS